ncbi:MAG: platelet-activating factor acetylhydrolase IB subunit [Candidatus Hydrogenedentes bacterium]|nr:platelet-activating factor acetylhydrolase IB subunit [Candidatus Hydrogenedentota bacterium]
MRKLMVLRVMTMALVFVVCCAAMAVAAEPADQPASRSDQGWLDRQASFNERVKQGDVDMIFIGDSITQGWEGGGKATWDKFYGKRNAVNLGISGDRTQHVLYRLDNGNIDGISPKLAVIMIGTNNASEYTPDQIAGGIKTIVQKLRAKLPDMEILLLGVFPREEKPGELRAKLVEVNKQIAKLDDGKKVFFLDIGDKFTQPDGSISVDIMPDFLHLTEKGYDIWANSIEPKVKQLLGEK